MEELCWALQIGDLDKVKEQLQSLTSENSVIILRFTGVSFENYEILLVSSFYEIALRTFNDPKCLVIFVIIYIER